MPPVCELASTAWSLGSSTEEETRDDEGVTREPVKQMGGDGGGETETERYHSRGRRQPRRGRARGGEETSESERVKAAVASYVGGVGVQDRRRCRRVVSHR